MNAIIQKLHNLNKLDITLPSSKKSIQINKINLELQSRFEDFARDVKNELTASTKYIQFITTHIRKEAKEDINYINAHGTSTPLGDEIELSAIKKLFGKNLSNLSVSSTKSSIGHLLGAAGAVEAIFSILSVVNDIAPPTLNLTDPCKAAFGFDLVPFKAKKRKIKMALSNSFGFGGTNASLIVGKVQSK